MWILGLKRLITAGASHAKQITIQSEKTSHCWIRVSHCSLLVIESGKWRYV